MRRGSFFKESHQGFYFLFQTEYKEILVVPSATGKLRRGELGRGRNGAPGYKVTRENQSPLEWSWHWRHRNQQTADQWAPLGGGSRRGPGQDIAPRKVCHALSKPPPTPHKVAGDPVTCSDVWVWALSPPPTPHPPPTPFLLNAGATPTGRSFGTADANWHHMMVNVSLIHSGRLYPHLTQPLLQGRCFFQPMKTFVDFFFFFFPPPEATC